MADLKIEDNIELSAQPDLLTPQNKKNALVSDTSNVTIMNSPSQVSENMQPRSMLNINTSVEP